MTEPTIGPLIRRLRIEAGRSQSEQATLLSDLAGRPVTRNEVSRWENETRLLTPYWQRYYAETLRTTVDDLRRAVAATKAQRRRQGVTSRDGEDPVQRREFVSAAFALAGTAISLSEFTGRRLAPSDVARLRQRTARLRRLDDFLGGADTYPLYLAEFDGTARLANESSYGEATGRELLSVLAEQAQQAGWAAFDAGRQREAQGLYRRSLTIAQQANDGPLAGNALAFLAYQMISTDKPSVETAVAACDTAGPAAPPAVRALLAERLAWTDAVAGQSGAAERALGSAQAAVSTSDDDSSPDWARWVDDLEIRIMTGRCWTELRRPLRAVPVLERVLHEYDDTHARDKALYLTWLADAYAEAREIEQAARVLGSAVELSTGVASVRPAARINGSLARLALYRSLPAVAEVFQTAGR